MRHIAIIGAGETGGLLARALVEREACRSIALIDAASNVAAGKALDVLQSAPIHGSNTIVRGASDLLETAAADLIVVADRHGAEGEWNGPAAVEMLRRVRAVAREAPLLFAGPSHRTLMLHARHELQVPASLLAGTAPEALAASARALVALAAGASPRDVRTPTVGNPGGWIVAWSNAWIGSRPAAEALPAAALLRLEAQIAACWPPGPYALASAAASAVVALAKRSAAELMLFVPVEQTGDVRSTVAALPARVGPGGAFVVIPPALSDRERVRLETSLSAG